MATSLETLISYTPTFVRRHYADQPDSQPSPTIERHYAALLYAEIGGFTPLMETVGQVTDQVAIAEFSQLLNDYFGQLIELINMHGGEIIKVAGSTLLVLWPVGVTGPDLTIVTRRAAACALALHEWHQQHAPNLLNAHCAEVTGGVDALLILRSVIDAGVVWAATVGGVNGHWEFLIAGPALAHLNAIQTQAHPDDTLIAPTAWDILAPHCRGEAHGLYVRLHSVVRPLKPRSFPPIELSPQTESSLRSYISPIVLAQLDTGYTQWLAEVRQVSVIFLNIHHLPEVPRQLALSQHSHEQLMRNWLTQVQDVLYDLQHALFQFEGSIIQFMMDDKGLVLIAAWGVPLHHHEDNALRAVRSALQSIRILQEHDLKGNIGIASGQVLCGNRGNARRRHFDLMGETMNFAAYLMQIADDDIICDSQTYRQTQAYLEFDTLLPINFHGNRLAHTTYRPLPPSIPHHSLLNLKSHSDLIGRRQERQVLSQQLQRLQQQQQGCVVILEGETGIGKTRLLQDFMQHANYNGVFCLSTHAQPANRRTPYHIWQSLLQQLVNYEWQTYQPAQLVSHLLNCLSDLPNLSIRLPLLNALLPLRLAENELTAQLQGSLRADNIHTLVSIVLQQVLSRSQYQYVLIIEDTHYLDSASWALLNSLSRQGLPMLLLLTLRTPQPSPLYVTGEQPSSPKLHTLLQTPNSIYLTLNTLAAPEIIALICQRLGVTSLPPALMRLLREKGNGNPLFSEELAYALRDQGLIRIVDGGCQLAPHVVYLDPEDFPDTLEGVLTTRVAQLTDLQRLSLQIASAVDYVFSADLLQAIYPQRVDLAQLNACLVSLYKLQFIRVLQADTHTLYQFKHSLIRDVVYAQLSKSQRVQIHTALATWYEQLYNETEHAQEQLVLQALHWEQAQRPDKAIPALTQLAASAFQLAADQEAIYFYHRACHMDDAHSSSQATAQRVQRALQQGEAYARLGQLGASQEALEQALALLKRPVPNSRIRLWLHITRLSVQQWWKYRRPIRPQSSSPADQEQNLQAAQAYEQLGRLLLQAQLSSFNLYFDREWLTGLYARLQAVQLAESVNGTAPVLARSYAAMCLTADILAKPALATFYQQRALHSVTDTSHMATVSWVYLLTSIHDLGQGHWSVSQNRFVRAIEIAVQLGDPRRQLENLNLLICVNYYQGMFKQSIQQAQAMYSLAGQQSDLQPQVWGLCAQALGFLRLGELETAVQCLKSVQELPREDIKLTEAIRICGILTLVYGYQGLPKQSIQMATKTSHLLEKMPPMAIDLLESYASVAQIYLMRWEAHSQPTDDEHAPAPLSSKERYAFARLSRRACEMLSRYARVFPIAKPRALLWQGLHHWLQGRTNRARSLWRESMNCAARLGMVYEEGLAHYELARHAESGDVAGRLHLQQAQRIFEHLAARHDLARVEALLRQQREAN